ncbi:MAG: carboxypeptidase-like regulatory domain-containing protein [Bacteroidia bacterium]|nr:carboxypeptidase-like regulatory domain-containing protein [Bacteroidia bacterium]
MRWKTQTSILLILLPILSMGQDWKRISGEVKDIRKGMGIPYAQIRILNSSLGVITNFSGEFRISIPERHFGDTLRISSIGYQSKDIPIQSLLDSNFISLPLGERIYSLEEIAIKEKRGKELGAGEIVRRAVNRIKKNVPDESMIINGFYRDYLLREGEYINLMEAALKVYDKGIQTYDYKKTQIELEQFRFRQDIQIDTFQSGSYASGEKMIPEMKMNYAGRNEFSILRLHDPIRNFKHPSFAFVFITNKYFLTYHNFKLDSLIIQDEDFLYEISFELVDDPVYKHLIEGKLFIRASDFAILKFSYTNFFKPEEEEEGVRYEILVEYQDFEEQMVLKYISMNNYLNTRIGNPSFKIDTIRVDTLANRLILRFNKTLDFRSSGNPKNYKVWIDGLRFKVENIVHNDPAEVSIPFRKKLKIDRPDQIRLEAENILSAYGEILNVYPTASMYQYREFFVNEVEIGEWEEREKVLVNKELPLYRNEVEQIPGFWENYNMVLSQPLKKLER